MMITEINLLYNHLITKKKDLLAPRFDQIYNQKDLSAPNNGIWSNI